MLGTCPPRKRWVVSKLSVHRGGGGGGGQRHQPPEGERAKEAGLIPCKRCGVHSRHRSVTCTPPPRPPTHTPTPVPYVCAVTGSPHSPLSKRCSRSVPARPHQCHTVSGLPRLLHTCWGGRCHTLSGTYRGLRRVYGCGVCAASWGRGVAGSRGPAHPPGNLWNQGEVCGG